MPPNPPASPAQTLSRGILLVEEYGALAAAIVSALKKFAPLHEVRVAHTFEAAEAAGAAMRPELFVLDLDPPPRGEIEFLDKLRTQFSEARMLVIAAGTSPELRAERGTAGAIQFIEKPFDLAEFGAAVQALLGPWALPPSEHFRGTLRDLHVVDIVELKCLAGSTALVRLETPEGRVGDIHFRHGQICHATTGRLTGISALEEIVRWPGGKVSEAELPGDSPQTIDTPWAVLLLQVVRKIGENRKPKSLGKPAPRAAAARKIGKKILAIDDTEMMLIFVADVLTIEDPSFQIFTASTGGEGLKLAATARPDLVLLDYSLTDMNGAQVCRELLANEATARIPVLMMSGHLAEMETTAETYGNVVATLAKPFLSGALINAVEKILAAGPLAKSPRLPPAIEPVAPAQDAPLSPNGHGHEHVVGGNGGHAAAPSAPAEAPPPASPTEPPSVETPALPVVSRAAVPAPEPVITQPETLSAIAPVVRQTQVIVTLPMEVVSMQLTSFFRMDELKLKPVGSSVAVKMSDRGGMIGVPVDTGFHLEAAELDAKGKIATIRLTPALQPPPLAAGESSFAIGNLNLLGANGYQNVELTATEAAAMHVQVTAQFELVSVELSLSFGVAAMILKSRSTTVQIKTGAAGDGAPFEVNEVQLDPSARLETLFVRPAP